uniref:Galectin n=1 Tax=Denticeps clupeoides TaxID=299321 RepID=A0AAY4BH63_9TELE
KNRIIQHTSLSPDTTSMFLKIPFTGSIVGGLQDGRSVVVTGRVLPGAQRFHVNLQCGSWPGAVIALHCNPRYDSGPSGYVVANAFQGSWGSEERKAPSPFPQGCPFTLMILVTPESYKVRGAESGLLQPKTCGALFFWPLTLKTHQQHVTAVPYKTIINGGLYSGKTINIQGVVNPTAKRFSVNLQSRAGIVLHYNPRFDENVVVRNSFLGGVWGPEERGGGMPFHRGNAFTITVICNPQGYSVMLNGAQVHSFDHRHHNLQEIDVLEVSGDLSLTSVMA